MFEQPGQKNRLHAGRQRLLDTRGKAVLKNRAQGRKLALFNIELQRQLETALRRPD
jgi:hypothetical protein